MIGRSGMILFGTVFLGQLFLGTIFLGQMYKLQEEVMRLREARGRDRSKIVQLQKEIRGGGGDDNNNNHNSNRGLLWEVEELPIQRSISKGFRPVYVYSNPETAKNEIPRRTSETNLNHKVYEPYSQVNQDKIVLALTKANDEKQEQKKGGRKRKRKQQKYFVDLAANHAIKLSNTLLLEQNGWTGLCIEGNPEYWYLHARHRTCTIIGAFVGGKTDGTQTEIALRGMVGGIIRDDMDNKKKDNNENSVNMQNKKVVEKRDLVTISTVLRETNTPRIIDYFSLDVEGAESFIMADFPWKEYKFRFLTIERPKKDLEEQLITNGYKMVQKLVAWGETLWMHEESVLLSQQEMEQIISSFQQPPQQQPKPKQ